MLVLHIRKFGKCITQTIERCLSDLLLLLGFLYRLAAPLLPPLLLQLDGLWCARDLRGTLTACVDLFEQQSQVRHLTGIHSATVSVDLEALSSLLECIDNLFDFSIRGRVLGTHCIEILKVMSQNRHPGRYGRGQGLESARDNGEQASGVVLTTSIRLATPKSNTVSHTSAETRYRYTMGVDLDVQLRLRLCLYAADILLSTWIRCHIRNHVRALRRR
jgi:hypothetical protein